MPNHDGGWVGSYVPLDPELPPSYVDPLPLAAIGAVSTGGALGAVSRAWLSEVQAPSVDGWPWATLTVNVTGAFAIGVLMAILASRFPRSRFARLFFGTGLLGGYTTFSALAVEAVDLTRLSSPALAALYVATSVAGAIIACFVGLAVTKRGLDSGRRGEVTF